MRSTPRHRLHPTTHASHTDTDPAYAIAAGYGIRTLSRAHWEIIETLREYHARFGVPPSMAQVHHQLGKPAYWTHGLFGSALTAWQIAGLPDPGEEAKSYLEDM